MATTYGSAVPADKDGHNDSHEHVDPFWSYITVFATLMVLLVLTYGAYFIPFEKVHNPFGDGDLGWVNTAVALTIATTKTMLVLLVFMHLRHSTKLTWIVASAGFIWLCIMIFFTFSDYLSRGFVREYNNTPQSNANAIVLQQEPKGVDVGPQW